MDTLIKPNITSLDLLHRGKVRYVYAVDEEHLLMVTTDRISVYDLVLPDAIPGKGRILNLLSCFWFKRLQQLIPNHLSSLSPEQVLSPAECSPSLLARSVVVRRLQPIPYEAVVRGYLFGSAWRSYHQGTALGELAALPAGMQIAQKLPAPVFTPTTKAARGEHDEMVDFAQLTTACGASIAEQIRQASLSIYQSCCPYALQRGLIIADTKLEFGLDKNGLLVLMDELLTPDSSRLWLADHYRHGISPPSFDKQYVRDYMDSIAWQADKPPRMPAAVIARSSEKYQQAASRLLAVKPRNDEL